MLNQDQITNNKIKTAKFDLEERTSKFGEKIVLLCQSLSTTFVSEIIIKQLVRSATSVGANYMEANGADSKRDFRNKLSICKKEAKETYHWLRMLIALFPSKSVELQGLRKESHELILIFSAIIKKLY